MGMGGLVRMKLLGEPNKKQVFVVHPKKVSLSISMKCCPHSDPTRSTTAALRSTKNVPQYSFLVQIHEITGCICIETQMNKKLAYSKTDSFPKVQSERADGTWYDEWTFCAMPQEEGLNWTTASLGFAHAVVCVPNCQRCRRIIAATQNSNLSRKQKFIIRLLQFMTDWLTDKYELCNFVQIFPWCKCT